jgi:hypothetical protein
MDTLRSFASNNRSMIMNVVYVVAFFVVLYYLYKFLIAGNELEFICQSGPTPANVPGGAALTKRNVLATTGGEYNLTFWMYISNWDYRSGQAKSVIQLVDQNTTKFDLLSTILYPNEAKMMVRVHTQGAAQGDTDYTMKANRDNLLNGSAGAGMFTPGITMPMCDLQDIDLQRWINITISVNGRIVDVYYDGKLNRSCVLPDVPYVPDGGAQAVMWGNSGGFGGQISGVTFYAYALTPDRIYSIYQAGPGASGGLLGYIGDMLGIKLTYAGEGGKKKTLL